MVIILNLLSSEKDLLPFFEIDFFTDVKQIWLLRRNYFTHFQNMKKVICSMLMLMILAQRLEANGNLVFYTPCWNGLHRNFRNEVKEITSTIFLLAFRDGWFQSPVRHNGLYITVSNVDCDYTFPLPVPSENGCRSELARQQLKSTVFHVRHPKSIFFYRHSITHIPVPKF